MGYEVFALLLGVAVVGLLWERYKLMKELNHAKAVAALLIAEKMGLKLNGEVVKVELEEMKERNV